MALGQEYGIGLTTQPAGNRWEIRMKGSRLLPKGTFSLSPKRCLYYNISLDSHHHVQKWPLGCFFVLQPPKNDFKSTENINQMERLQVLLYIFPSGPQLSHLIHVFVCESKRGWGGVHTHACSCVASWQNVGHGATAAAWHALTWEWPTSHLLQ